MSGMRGRLLVALVLGVLPLFISPARWQPAGAQLGPAIQPGRVAIWTDHQQYHIGDPIHVCYAVPAPGPITITDMFADGRTQTFFSGFDDGTGGCLPGTVTPPAGTECLRIDYMGSLQATPGQVSPVRPNSAQTCFQVIGPHPSPIWTVVGSAEVVDGHWNYDGRARLDPSLTYVRVTSGRCDDNPASTLVWEGTLHRDGQGGRLGTDVWSGALAPVGLAISNGGSGHARIARPVTLNPVSQIDLTLFGVGIINDGATFTACLRQP